MTTVPTSIQDSRLYLDGKWVDFDNHIEVINPATGAVFAQVAVARRPDVAQAIDTAQEAFEPWRKLTARRRGDYLLAVASESCRRSGPRTGCRVRVHHEPVADTARCRADRSGNHRGQ